jgi:hypothetical protein
VGIVLRVVNEAETHNFAIVDKSVDE